MVEKEKIELENGEGGEKKCKIRLGLDVVAAPRPFIMERERESGSLRRETSSYFRS